MLNVLFRLIPPITLTDEQRATFQQIAFWTPVPECQEGTYQAFVESIEDMVVIEAALNQITSAHIIGVWNEDGTQYGFERQTDENGTVTTVQVQDPLQYPLDRQAYLDALMDVVVTDENGTEISRTRPTEIKPVNKFSGKEDRDL